MLSLRMLLLSEDASFFSFEVLYVSAIHQTAGSQCYYLTNSLSGGIFVSKIGLEEYLPCWVL